MQYTRKHRLLGTRGSLTGVSPVTPSENALYEESVWEDRKLEETI